MTATRLSLSLNVIAMIAAVILMAFGSDSKFVMVGAFLIFIANGLVFTKTLSEIEKPYSTKQ